MTITADVTVVARSKIDQINREYELFERSLGDALEHGLHCGQMLLAVKAELRHGEWMPWVQEQFAGSHRRANEFMQLASSPEFANSRPPANLTIEEALKQIRKPKQLSTGQVQGLLAGMGSGSSSSPALARETSEDVWQDSERRKHERAGETLAGAQAKMTQAAGAGLSRRASAELFKDAAVDARRAAAALDELAFSFER